MCKNILKVFCHSVAQLISRKDETVLFEFNEKEPYIAQRGMYENPENLNHLYISSWRHIWHDGRFIRCYFLEETPVVDRSFGVVYRLLFQSENVSEITFTVLPNKQIVIW